MTLSTQFITMLTMVGMGVFFGISLDTYQYFLKRTERKRLVVFFHDLLFWFFQALLIFYVLFLVNQGEVRVYLILALLLGFTIYKSLFQSLYLRLLKILISTIVQTANFIAKLVIQVIYKPIRMLLLFIVSILIFLLKGLKTLVRFVLRVLRFIIKSVFLPIKWLLSLIWLILPNKVKIFVEKFYGYLAGYYRQIEKYWNKWISNRKKR